MKIKKLLKKYTTNSIDDNCYYNAEDMIDFAKYVLKEKLTLHGVSNCTSCGIEINYKGLCEVCYCKGNAAYEV